MRNSPNPNRWTALLLKTVGMTATLLLGLVVVATPANADGQPGGVASVASDEAGSCAVLSGGGVHCWGDNTTGQLGNGTAANSLVPVAVVGIGGIGLLGSVTSVVAASSRQDFFGTYCALLAEGGVDCWGYNGVGELGNGTTTNSSVPVAVLGVGGSGLLGGVVNLVVNNRGFCGLLVGGGVDCWGLNSFGELGSGNGTGYRSSVPVAVVGTGGSGLLSGVASLVSSLGYDTCAVLTGGGVDCWGENNYGQLGDGSYYPSSIPVAVPGIGGSGSLTNVASMVSTATGSCAVLTGGGVDCWGDTSDPVHKFPVAVLGLGGSGLLGGVASLALSTSDYCALLSSGGVDCWGGNNFGSLGNGTDFTSPVPVAVLGVAGNGLLGGVASLVSDNGIFDHYDTFCAVLTVGGVDCWGYNGNGEVGNGSFTGAAISVPVPVFGVARIGLLGGVVSMASGYGSFCAVLSGGGLDCWGYNGNGDLGNGSTTDSPLPVAVTYVPSIVGMSPSSGPVGTAVTITGSNLDGATQVTFGGVSATVTQDTTTKIKVTVPVGATTGKIKVFTPGGKAKSPSVFTVT